ncbi:MAG: hypothetical protein ACOC5R_01545 [Elusimicrobiota bacterium]
MKNSIIILMVLLISGCGTLSVPTPGIDLSPDINVNAPAQQQTQPQTVQYERNAFRMMSTYFFSVGGIWPWQKEFKPGQWCKWQMKTQGETNKAELALLKRMKNNREWWRMRMNLENKKNEMIFESLINSTDYSLRRLRSKMGEGEPHEVPIAEGSYIQKPIKLTQESVSAATVGQTKVSVPAGDFTCDHVKYGDITGKGTMELWVNYDVPGGVVKYRFEANGDSYTVELIDYGTGAKTVLNSY